MGIDKQYPGLALRHAIPKRIFDIVLSIVALTLLWPVIAAAWLISSIETGSNGLFLQKRVGFKGKEFRLIKIKTMHSIHDSANTVTTRNDSRISKSGAFFRKTKIDELPQLWNVLIGDMSIVGPRPDVPGYADRLQGEDLVILSVRPGITGPATLKYKNEEDLLARQENPNAFNDKVIWPDKVSINREYVERFSFRKDLYYIWKTLFE